MLDIKHRRSLAGDHAFQGDPVQRVVNAGRNIVPRDADGLAGLALGGDAALKERRIHGFNDLPQSDGVRRAGKQIAAGFAAAAFDEAGSAQVIENLHKKVRGHGFALRHLIKPCKTPPVMDLRELSEGPAGVFQFL